MGRLIDANDVYNAIQITTDNFGVLKGVVESNMLTMLSKIETAEAIPKAEYEAKLKDDTLAVLEKIADEINKRIQTISYSAKLSDIGTKVGYMYSLALIRANIHALKENGEK